MLNHFTGIIMTSKRSSFLLLSLSVLALSACAGGNTAQKYTPETTMNPRLQTSAIDKAMERALAQAEESGNRQEILALLGQINARNPEDAIVATRLGRALREDNQINAAIRTLVPFTTGDNKNIEALTEMSMAQISSGDFEQAENFAQQSIEMNPKNARGYLALGTAQDALKRHQDAEISFREGLKNWRGDATPILNNLALNLASQGHLREALALLEKAQKLSPGRMDLERNRRIIATLVETSQPQAPKPPTKPQDDVNHATEASPQEKELKRESAPIPPEAKTETEKLGEPQSQIAKPPKTKIKNLKTKTGSAINQ